MWNSAYAPKRNISAFIKTLYQQQSSLLGKAVYFKKHRAYKVQHP